MTAPISPATATSAPWGTTQPTSTQPATNVDRYRLTAPGIAIEVITYGASLVRVETNDDPANLVLGLDDLAAYEDPARNASMGATVGRFANRIAVGRFSLDDTDYELAINNGPNHLHGGPTGFGRMVWSAEPKVLSDEVVELVLTLRSPDGHEGYPGTVEATTTYRLEPHKLTMIHTATTDAATPINITNHAYWDLTGSSEAETPTPAAARSHVLQVAADHYIPVDQTLIPTGEVAPVSLTPFDLNSPTSMAAAIDGMSGIDICYVVDGDLGQPCVSMSEANSGRSMLVSTDQPGMQVYTADHLGHAAICLEAQRWPDSPNQPDFPSCILEPGQTYTSTTVHDFS